MKNIYDLLNQAEDNEDILSENERMEMTDIEKRRIYNRILLDSEEEQEEQSCDEQKKYQDYEAKADAYEAELEWQDISIEAENQEEKITLNRYALTPNGPKIDATVEEKKGTDSIYEEDGYTKLDFMRIVAWDDLGNYYLMYGRSKDYNIDDSTIPYHQRFTIYDGSNGSLDGQENRDYKLVWDENASTVTFAMEKKTDKWDAETKEFAGADYEFVSEPYTVELVKN